MIVCGEGLEEKPWEGRRMWGYVGAMQEEEEEDEEGGRKAEHRLQALPPDWADGGQTDWKTSQNQAPKPEARAASSQQQRR